MKCTARCAPVSIFFIGALVVTATDVELPACHDNSSEQGESCMSLVQSTQVKGKLLLELVDSETIDPEPVKGEKLLQKGSDHKTNDKNDAIPEMTKEYANLLEKANDLVSTAKTHMTQEKEEKSNEGNMPQIKVPLAGKLTVGAWFRKQLQGFWAFIEHGAEQYETESATGIIFLFLLLAVIIGCTTCMYLIMQSNSKQNMNYGEQRNYGEPRRYSMGRGSESGGYQHHQAPRSYSREPDDLCSEVDNIQFCPDLVVPEKCECILVVPIRPATWNTFDVTDMNGNVVLHVAPQNAPPSSGNLHGRQQGPRQLVLQTASRDVLAQCCAARATMAPAGHAYGGEYHLLRAGGDYFATLKRSDDQDRYELKMLTGDRFFFWGDFEHHAMNITDTGGRLLATAELCDVDFDRTGEFYRLRAAPQTDVGLVLCSLLCIDHLGDAFHM